MCQFPLKRLAPHRAASAVESTQSVDVEGQRRSDHGHNERTRHERLMLVSSAHLPLSGLTVGAATMWMSPVLPRFFICAYQPKCMAGRSRLTFSK